MKNLNCLSCHIIGFNPYTKKEFIDKINNKIFNIIDLDIINQEILQNDALDKLYRQYQKLKDDKNDKYKEVNKKMTQFWEKSFIDTVESKVNNKKMNILIGQNSHYKSLGKRINIDCTNKFLVKSDIDDEIKAWIKYDLETYKDNIINGEFPLEYINYDYLRKKRLAIETTYKKINYIEKTPEQINTIINLIENSSKNNGKEMWIALKEPYNINSLIHPKANNKITAYSDMNMALLNSVNFNDNEIIQKGGNITIQEIKPGSLKKLKTRRILYLLDSTTFIPDEEGNYKFFSQLPVKVLAKEKIDNLYNYFIGS